MSVLGPHAGYIVGAIGFSVVCLVVLVGTIVAQYRRLTAQLKTLEDQGLSRRTRTGS